MEVQKNSETGGSLQISTQVISNIAKLAAMEVDGVQDVSAVAPSMRSILGQKARNTMKAVSVQMEDGVAQITVNLLVAYGSRIPSMCAKVQENVKSTVQNMTGITVSRVNVVVRGVVVPQAAE